MGLGWFGRIGRAFQCPWLNAFPDSVGISDLRTSKTASEASEKKRRASNGLTATDPPSGFVVGDGLDLQALDGLESGPDRLHFPGTGFLIPVDGFQFHGQIAQQVESIVELVPNEQSHVDGFFNCVLGFRG